MKVKMTRCVENKDNGKFKNEAYKVDVDVSKLKKEGLVNQGNVLLIDIFDNWDKYSIKDKERVVLFLNYMNDFNFSLEHYDQKKRNWWTDFFDGIFGGGKK